MDLVFAPIGARKKQGVSADVDTMDNDLQGVPHAQISVIGRRIKNVIAQTEPLPAKAILLRSIPGIAPVSAAMIPEFPEPGRITSGEAATMTGLAPAPSTWQRGQCEAGERSRAADRLCDMCCSKLRSLPPATIQFSSPPRSVSKSAEIRTDS